MLVLSRKYGESIVIAGGVIRVTVLREVFGKIRLGIDAPKAIRIDREEMVEPMTPEQFAAMRQCLKSLEVFSVE